MNSVTTAQINEMLKTVNGASHKILHMTPQIIHQTLGMAAAQDVGNVFVAGGVWLIFALVSLSLFLLGEFTTFDVDRVVIFYMLIVVVILGIGAFPICGLSLVDLFQIHHYPLAYLVNHLH